MPVSIVKCESYKKEDVGSALKALLDGIGGLDKYVPFGARVFIKANLVGKFAPEKAATTHPALIEALARILIEERGATVTVGDSPGGLYNNSFLNGVYNGTKMADACKNSGAELNRDFGSTEVNYGGVALKGGQIIDAFLNADFVINFSKFKTHGLAGFSGCVKNLFGLIPGLAKVGMHSRFETIDTFSDCLIDIERFAAAQKPMLHLMDGIIGMHKDGPTNGEPISINRLIASDNAHHADCVAISVFGNPLDFAVIQKAVKRGILQPDLGDVPYDLNSTEKNENYIPIIAHRLRLFPGWLQKIVQKLTTKKAKIIKSKCVGCQTCVNHCPKKTIKFKNKKAKIKQRRCIRCYCCQELCPIGAVALKKPILSYEKKKK